MPHTININVRTDAIVLAHLARFLQSKGSHIKSGSHLIDTALHVASGIIKNNSTIKPPSTYTEAEQILSGIITVNMKTTALTKAIGNENFNLERIDLTDNATPDLSPDSSFMQEAMKKLDVTNSD